MTKKDSVSTAIRIPQDVYEKIEFQSDSENTNISTIINNVLRKHVTWDQFVSDIGFVFVQKPFLRGIFEKVSDEHLIEAARTVCHSGMRDAVIFIHGKISILGIIDVVKLWLSASDIPLRIVETDNEVEFRIQHNLGTKGSLYFSTLLNTLFSEIGIKLKKSVLKDHAVIVSFKLKNNNPKKK